MCKSNPRAGAEGPERWAVFTVAVGAGVVLLVAGCATGRSDPVVAQRLLAQSVTAHLQGDYRGAARGYQRVLRQYRDQPALCATALRSLGNVRAAQGRTDDAVRLFERVGVEYADHDWEVLQAWKSAADLLWESGRVEEARGWYRRIVGRFDGAELPAVHRWIVQTARQRS
jgi:TolA-binding protein